MQNVRPVGLFFFFQVRKILHSLREKKCQLKRRFEINLQAFDKYVHSNARYGLK